MKKTIAILMAVTLVGLVGVGCTRDESILPSSEGTLPDMISSVPMPTVPEDEESSSEGIYLEPSDPEVESYSAPENLPTMGVDFSQIDSLSAESVTWGPGVRMDEDGRSEACVYLQDLYQDYGSYFIMPNEEKLYLTFDQGYENGFTEQILDTLLEKEVKAVFFLTGYYAQSQPELVQRMIDEGHIIGNHTTDHINHANATLAESYDDTQTLHDYVLEEFDYKMWLFRYPEGAFNEQTLALHQQMGYIPCFWSFGYQDWNPDAQMSHEEALEKLQTGLQPGSIILLHSVGQTNAEILGEFIDMARDEGYSFELLNPEYIPAE